MTNTNQSISSAVHAASNVAVRPSAGADVIGVADLVQHCSRRWPAEQQRKAWDILHQLLAEMPGEVRTLIMDRIKNKRARQHRNMWKAYGAMLRERALSEVKAELALAAAIRAIVPTEAPCARPAAHMNSAHSVSASPATDDDIF